MQHPRGTDPAEGRGKGSSWGAAALVPWGPSVSQRDCANSQLWEPNSLGISALHFAPRLP